MKFTHKVTILCLITSILLSCLVYSFAEGDSNRNVPDTVHSTSQPESALSPDVDDVDLELLAELSTDKYNTLLRAWSDDPNYISDRYANFPSFYGGSYTDDNKELVILVTSLSEDVINYFGDLIDLDHVRFSLVEHSLQELFDAKETIDELLMSGDLDDELLCLITGTGIGIKENKVNVYVATEDIESLNNDYMSSLFSNNSQQCGINFVTLYFPTQSDQPTVTDCNDGIVPNILSGILVQPGGPIRIEGVSNAQSVGFWAKDYFGNLGIVTASHGNTYFCPKVYATKDGTKNDVYFGYASDGNNYYGGAVDATFVVRDTDQFNPITYVDGWDFNLKSQTIVMNVGDEIYKRGIGTGVTRGKVVDLHFNPSNYEGDCKLTDVVLTDCSAFNQDSGGIVAGRGTTSSRYVAGIVVGGAKLRGSDNDKWCMYYCRANDILQELRITLY